MSNCRTLPLLTLIALLSIVIPTFGQSDSLDQQTAFRKSRWLIGISGTIGSGTVRTDAASSSGFNAEYSLSLSGSKFVTDGLAVGMIVRGQRNNPLRDQRESESAFIGPLVTYFFSKNPVGSAYIQAGPGYVRYREESILDSGGQQINEEVVGNGAGLVSTFGYSIVIKDIVGFDLGFTLVTAWLTGDRTSDPPLMNSQEKFRIGDYSFSFGFKVLL